MEIACTPDAEPLSDPISVERKGVNNELLILTLKSFMSCICLSHVNYELDGTKDGYNGISLLLLNLYERDDKQIDRGWYLKLTTLMSA